MKKILKAVLLSRCVFIMELNSRRIYEQPLPLVLYQKFAQFSTSSWVFHQCRRRYTGIFLQKKLYLTCTLQVNRLTPRFSSFSVKHFRPIFRVPLKSASAVKFAMLTQEFPSSCDQPQKQDLLHVSPTVL